MLKIIYKILTAFVILVKIMPINFYIIIIFQLAVFLWFWFFFDKDRKFSFSLIKRLAQSGLFGLAIGIPFDIVLSSVGIHSYISKTSLYPWGISFTQLMINGVLSYGIAVATAYYIPHSYKYKKELANKKMFVLMLLSIILLSILATIFSSFKLLTMFTAGLVIVSSGELLLLKFSRVGLLVSTLVTYDYKNFLKVWGSIIFIGLVYEIVNLIFPFWVWLPGENHSSFFIESLVIFFGYVVLIHPMIVVWQMIDKK